MSAKIKLKKKVGPTSTPQSYDNEEVADEKLPLHNNFASSIAKMNIQIEDDEYADGTNEFISSAQYKKR